MNTPEQSKASKKPHFEDHPTTHSEENLQMSRRTYQENSVCVQLVLVFSGFGARESFLVEMLSSQF